METEIEIKNPWKFKDVGVEHTGTRITLPVGMSMESGIEELKRLIADQETETAVFEPVDCFPLEGAYAMMKVLRKKFGWARAVPTPSFFGPRPPVMVNLPLSVTESTQVIWGEFVLPGLQGKLSTGLCKHESENRVIFCLNGVVRRKFEPSIKEIAAEIRKEVRDNSIYQGKAIQLMLNEKDVSSIDWNKPPIFLDTTRARPGELIFSDGIDAQVRASLFNPIRFTERCRKHGVPLKRGILLAGPYGTGKTLTAQVVARLCEENRWTYVHLKDVRALGQALTFARRYQPAVVFAEDVDRVVGDQRTVEVDRILNTIDGVDSKGTEVMTILTTNNVEEISPAMLRPGRLDAVIKLVAPDSAAVQKLLRMYGRGLLNGGELKVVGDKLAGNIPAVIREVVERAKLHAISESDEHLKLTEQALCEAADGMIEHLALLNRGVTVETPEHQLGAAVAGVVDGIVSSRTEDATNRVIEALNQ